MSGVLNWLVSFLHSLCAFIIILVPLVVFHEFGHFLFAKFFGVKAEVFSVGFGTPLWRRQMGETEFRVSAIPMGGYVKLLGEDREAQLTPEEQKRALHRQKPWKRFFIFSGGPIFNFILAIFIFMVILMIGEPQMASVIGRVTQNSPAQKAGFQSGDRILAIDGRPIQKFEDVILELNENPGKQLEFTVQHPNQQTPVRVEAKTTAQEGISIYGESKPVGEIEGIIPNSRATNIGVSNPSSLAAQAQMETGDKILKINQTVVHSWEELESIYQGIAPGAPFEIEFHVQKEKGQNNKRIVDWLKPQGHSTLENAFGLHSSELFVDKVVPKSPAQNAGIQSGDRIIGVGSEDVQSFFDLRRAVQRAGEKEGKVLIRWERKGQILSSEFKPTATSARDPLLKKTTQFTIGIVPMLMLAEPPIYIERVWNPFKLAYMATERVVVFTWRNLVSLKKMITGDVSMGSLGGPIMIGKIAGESMARGLIVFLTNMAIFSIGLGVLNILPVPVLDGGHLLLLAVESIRGKPLTLRQMEIVQGLGFLFILALMGVAFHNDIARLIYS